MEQFNPRSRSSEYTSGMLYTASKWTSLVKFAKCSNLQLAVTKNLSTVEHGK